jgi:hypothetical protein
VVQLLISDTNILIDMKEGGLLSDVFLLPYQLCVPDILYYEELEEQHAHLLELGLTLLEISGNSLMMLELLKSIYNKPSTNDLLRGRISRFSLDALVNIAAALGRRVSIQITAA